MEAMTLDYIASICLINANRLVEAAHLLSTCKPDSEGIRSYLLGVIFAKQQYYDKAIQEFKQIPINSPYQARANLFLEWLKTRKSNSIYCLTSGYREETVRLWEDSLKKNSNNLKICHNLSVSSFWEAKYLEKKGKPEEIKSIWGKAIGYWAIVLSSDHFWQEWGKERAVACGIKKTDIDKMRPGSVPYLITETLDSDKIESYLSDIMNVRKQIERQFNNHFKEQMEKAKSMNMNDMTEMYEQLLLEWNHEMVVASFLERLKKIYCIIEYTNQRGLRVELENLMQKTMEHEGCDIDSLLDLIGLVLDIKHDSIDSIKGVPSCGPKMLKFFNHTSDIHDFVNNVLQIKSQNTQIAKLHHSLAPMFIQLQFYLDSELGQWLVMTDIGIFDNAIEGIIVKLKNTKPKESQARNLRVLLGKGCYGKVKSIYRPRYLENDTRKYDEVIEILEKANLFASDVIIDPFPFDFDIPQLIDEICYDILQCVDTQLLSIQEGIELLQRLCVIAPKGRDATCQRTLAALLE